MTLKDLCDRLDWAEIEAQRLQWEQKHPPEVVVSEEMYALQRMDRVKQGIEALQSGQDMDMWWILPRTIRLQIHDIYEKEGLLGNTSQPRADGARLSHVSHWSRCRQSIRALYLAVFSSLQALWHRNTRRKEKKT